MGYTPRLPPFVIYLSPELKSVFMHAADYSHKSLSEHIRDLLAADVETRAEQEEPHFAALQSELRKGLELNRQREAEIKSKPRARRKAQASGQETGNDHDHNHGFTEQERAGGKI